MAERNVQAFLKLARERFQQGQEASHNQRKRVLDDLAFYAGGEKQWDPDALRARKGHPADQSSGLPPVPARPCLTINKVREPVHQVLNQERQSDMGIQLVPADDWGELAPPVSEEEIELREGLVRRIQRESEAADARTWAFTRAAIAGEGYYRILTRYATGKTFDKEVFAARIYNQASVTLDPAHEQPDGSDCEWEFIGTDMPWDKYKREHPKAANGRTNPLAQSDDAQFRALGEEYPGWFKSEGDTKSARVVEYFYTEWTTRRLLKMADGTVAYEDELPEAIPEDQIIEEREEPKKAIKWAKIDATQILEETDWEGPDMPIIKVVGEELQPFDAERHVEGMVRPARDSQQSYNVMVSKWVESVGYAPIAPLSVEETNIGSYGNWYAVLNTRALPYVPYRQYDDTGRQIEKPERMNAETNIQAIAASVQLFDEAIKSTTMVPNVQLGQATDAHIKSGKAIQALQDQAQLGTSHLLDNLRRSIRYEGQVINNLLYPIYGRPGRLARMLNGENEPVTVKISAPPNGNGAMPGGQPYAQPGQGNQPPMAGGGAVQSPAIPQGMGSGGYQMGALSNPTGGPGGISAAAPPQQKTYTLTKDANFNVLVKVTRSFDSRRTEEATTIGNLLQQNPELMAWFGDLFFKNQDGPGHEEMAERAETMLDPKIQAMRASKEHGGAPIPPEVQAEMTKLKQQLDEAHGIMAKAQGELKDRTEQHKAEQQTKLQIAQMAHDQAIQIQQMRDATAIEVARISAAKSHLETTREAEEEALALVQQHAHEATQAELDRQHELDKMSHMQALQPPPPPDGQPSGGTA